MAKKSLAMKIENVSMKFNLSSEKVDNIKEYVIKMIKKELMFQEFWALRDISFEVQKGDRVGIMGLNGAGKSTLLKVISGVLKATQGTVTTNGKIAPLLAICCNRMARLHRFLNWEPDLIDSIPVLRTFICMVRCLVTVKSFWKHVTTKL